MLRLTYDRLTTRDGWVRYEELYTSNEARTCVEIARDKKARTESIRNVTVLDYRLVNAEVPCHVQAEDETLHYPVKVATKTLKVSSVAVVSLKTLPRKKAAPKAKVAKTVKILGIPVANEQQFPAPRRRVTKRERTFGNAVPVLS